MAKCERTCPSNEDGKCGSEWYCPKCGYIAGCRVTNNEQCDTCGLRVICADVDGDELLKTCPYTACAGKQLQSQLATANEEAKAGRTLWAEAQRGRKKLRLELDVANKELEKLREALRWIPAEERLPEETGQYILVVAEHGVEDINWNGQDSFSHWKPIALPKGGA